MPLDRKRRPWRRVLGRLLLLVVAAGLVLFVVIGGIVFVGEASGPYRQAVNRSFADQGSVLVDASDQTGRQLRQLMADLPDLRRTRLQDDLDGLVAAAQVQAGQAALLLPPPPPAGVGPSLVGVLDARAQEVSALRAAVDGLLGLSPQPVPGAAAPITPQTVPGQGTALLSSARALSDLQAVGTVLQRADQEYAGVRRVLGASAGHGRLPQSRWVTDGQAWSNGALSALVGELVSSASLATRHGLQLVTVGINPPAVPSPSGPVPAGGVTTVPPTGSLEVTVVLRNDGNVAEPDVLLTASAVPQHGGRGGTVHQHLSLVLGGTASGDLPPLAVQPGHTYSLRITAASSATAAGQSGTTTSYTVAVAPAAPPPTTTTTTITTTRPRHTATTTPAATPGGGGGARPAALPPAP